MTGIPKFLTIRQTAKTGVISEAHLRRMVKAGDAPGIYAGTRFMINFDLLVDLLNKQSQRGHEIEN